MGRVGGWMRDEREWAAADAFNQFNVPDRCQPSTTGRRWTFLKGEWDWGVHKGGKDEYYSEIILNLCLLT